MKAAIGIIFVSLISLSPFFIASCGDNDDEMQQFLLQRNVQLAKFHVQGMTCSSCEAKLKGELEKHDGVRTFIIDHHSGTTIVAFDSDKYTDKKIENIIKKSGFKAHKEPIN